jgi:hypothetical protein
MIIFRISRGLPLQNKDSLLVLNPAYEPSPHRLLALAGGGFSLPSTQFLPCLLNSHGGTGFGIDQSPRLAFRASPSNFFHSWQIGRSHYRVNTQANACRINSSLTTVFATVTSAPPCAESL